MIGRPVGEFVPSLSSLSNSEGPLSPLSTDDSHEDDEQPLYQTRMTSKQETALEGPDSILHSEYAEDYEQDAFTDSDVEGGVPLF